MKSGASTKRAFVTYSEVRYSFFRADVPSGVSDWRCSLSKHPPAPALCQHRYRKVSGAGFVGGNQTPSRESATRSRNRMETLAAARHNTRRFTEHKENHQAAVDTLIATWKPYYFASNIASNYHAYDDNMNTYICNQTSYFFITLFIC